MVIYYLTKVFNNQFLGNLGLPNLDQIFVISSFMIILLSSSSSGTNWFRFRFHFRFHFHSQNVILEMDQFYYVN